MSSDTAVPKLVIGDTYYTRAQGIAEPMEIEIRKPEFGSAEAFYIVGSPYDDSLNWTYITHVKDNKYKVSDSRKFPDRTIIEILDKDEMEALSNIERRGTRKRRGSPTTGGKTKKRKRKRKRKSTKKKRRRKRKRTKKKRIRRRR